MCVLEARRAAVAAELRRLRQRQRREKAVPPGIWATACLIHWLKPNAPSAALHFLQQKLPGNNRTPEEWAKKLREACERIPEVERDRLTTAPGTVCERRQLQRARTFLEEAALHDWVGNLNAEKEIAPVSALVLQEVSRHRIETSNTVAQAAKSKHRLQWLRRWRSRWGVHLARILPADRPTPEVCLRKATTSPVPQSQSPGRRNPSGSCCFFLRSQKGVPPSVGDNPPKKRGHLMAPKMGPHDVRSIR